MLAALVFACSLAPVTREEPPPAPAARAAPEVDLAWVHASMLRLREQPNPDAAFSPLAINTRIRIMERQDDWVRVIAPDGRTGWVHRDFLAGAPLTPVFIQQRLAAATTPEDKILWSERAAALSPADAGVLANLVAVYRAVGRAADADALEASLRAVESDRFDRMFPAHKDAVAEVRDALAGARSAAELVRVWRRARDLTAAMAEPLAATFDPATRSFVDGDPTAMLAERMPWAELRLYSEGTTPALELAARPWLDAAARSPEGWDDGFLSLVTTAYDNASARGWTAWQRRSWDYGGCSPFGSGENLHLALLSQCDTLASVSSVADVVAPIRAAVLRDIEKPAPDEFPFCDASGRQTPPEALVDEARRILADVRLTAEERTMLERRVAAGFAP